MIPGRGDCSKARGDRALIPDAQQLEEIAHRREGTLREIPFAILLQALALNRRTVVLEIERKPMTKDIIFEDGVPVDCRSNLLHETLGRFMVGRGELNEEQFQTCLKRAIAEDKQIGEVMIEEGHVDAMGLYKILQLNLAKKLLDGFSWREGKYRLIFDVPEVDSPLKVKAPQLIVMGISKFARLDEVNRAVGPLVGEKVFLHPDPPFPLSEIRLTKAQRELAQLLDNGKRMDELAAETTIPFDEITRLLYSLAVIGLVVPESRLPKMPPKPKPKPEPIRPVEKPAVAVAAKVDPAEADRLRNRLMSVYLRHRKQDAFDLLGLGEQASREEIDRHFLDFARRYAPVNFSLPGLEGVAEKAEELFLAGAQAYGELTDGEKRNSLIYRRRHRKDEKKKAGDRFAIKSDLLDTELQFKKGKALMQANKFSEAMQLLEFAYDCDPQNADYLAELAYCRFLDNPERRGSESLDELAEARRLDPKCGLAYFYAGEILGELERWDEAEELLRQSVKLLAPKDRRPIESLKYLQAQKEKGKGGFLSSFRRGQ